MVAYDIGIVYKKGEYYLKRYPRSKSTLKLTTKTHNGVSMPSLRFDIIAYWHSYRGRLVPYKDVKKEFERKFKGATFHVGKEGNIYYYRMLYPSLDDIYKIQSKLDKGVRVTLPIMYQHLPRVDSLDLVIKTNIDIKRRMKEAIIERL